MVQLLLLAFVLFGPFLFADDNLPRLCFRFGNDVTEPLRKPIPLLKGEDNFVQGATDKGVEWSAARGVVPQSPKTILDWLLDHTNWKDVSKTKLTLEHIPSKHFFDLHKLDVDANIFAFIWLHWTEEWAYRILSGDAKAPKSLLVSYQKVAGTDHIYRLCGNVLVKELSPGKSDIYFYEEAKANRYESSNMRELHVSNLMQLRRLKKK